MVEPHASGSQVGVQVPDDANNGVQGSRAAYEVLPDGWQHFDGDDYVVIPAPWPFSDPRPPPPDAGDEDRAAYAKELETHYHRTLDCYKANNFWGESLWIEVLEDFSPHGVFHHYPMHIVTGLRECLLSNGVFCEKRARLSRRQALAECLLQEACVELPSEEEDVDAGMQMPEAADDGNAQSEHSQEQRIIEANVQARPQQNMPKLAPEISPAVSSGQEITAGRVVVEEASTRRGNEPSDTAARSDRKEEGDRYGNTGTLIRMYQSRKRFLGHYNEDLEARIREYDVLCYSCRVSGEEKRNMVVLMLQDDSLEYYINNLSNLVALEDVFDGLRSWFTSSEQRQRVLVEWQSATFEQILRAYPQESEARCFQRMCARLSATQRQLDKAYHADTLLKDRIVQTMNARKDIMQALRAYPPETAHVAQQRIASFLSSGSRGFSEGGAASTTAYMVDRRFSFPSRSNRKQPGGRKKDLKCWVCQGPHRARERHTQEEVRSALKTKTNITEVEIDDEDLQFAFATTELQAREDHANNESDDEDDNASTHLTSSLCYETNEEIALFWADQAFCHAIRGSSVKEALEEMRNALRYGESAGFLGVAVDSACVGRSVIGIAQAKAYCRKYGVPMSVDESCRVKVTYGSGPVCSLGSMTLHVAIPCLDIECPIEFLVVPSDVPALLSLDDMDRRNISLHTFERRLAKRGADGNMKFSPLRRHPQHRLLFHEWERDDVGALYTVEELRKLHRSLGHRSVDQMAKVLRRARPDEFTPETRHALEEIALRCQACQFLASRPRRFKLTTGTEELRFNHCVLVDIMYIGNVPLLHAIDEATHFMAAAFLHKGVSAHETWKTLRRMWISTYLGPPDYLRVDAGVQFSSEEFRASCRASAIEVEEIPVESPSSLSVAERYHGPLRASYLKLEHELPGLDSDELLELAVKSVNDSVNPEGLCPTLLVFGCYPKLIRRIDLPAATQLERARAIDLAMEAVQAEYARARVQLGLRYAGPVGNETKALDNLPVGSEVLIFRERPNKWTGPFPLVSKDGETCVVQLPRGRRMFRSTAVKPYNRPLDEGGSDVSVEAAKILMANSSEQEECFATRVVNAKDYPGRFDAARAREFQGLLSRGTFRAVKKSEANGSRIYGMRYVDAIKNAGEQNEYEKSRLVVQAYSDDGSKHILTSAPTCQRVSQRLLLALAALHPGMSVYTRDISQAYTQATTSLVRRVFVKAPPEANVAEDEVLEVLLPLYGLPESGLHWFSTYQSHHITKLQMKDAEYDPCLLYRSSAEAGFEGAVVLQVDDSLGLGSAGFLDRELAESAAFSGKPRVILDKNEIQFNGFTIERADNGTLLMHQRSKLADVPQAMTNDEYASVRAKGAYIATCTRSDSAAPFQLLISTDPTASDFRKLNKLSERCRLIANSQNAGLRFVRQDLASLRLLVFADAAFANADGYASQLGAVIVLADADGRANILHWFSHKSKRITRSVAAAELYALVHGLDIAFVLKHTLGSILRREVQLCAYTDSRILFSSVTGFHSTAEKRLLIDLYGLRQSYNRREFSEIVWIASGDNVADPLTKTDAKCESLLDLMHTSRLSVRIQGSVQRT